MTVESMAPRSSVVIASDSEAIQDRKEELDCFVAGAPRNDVDGHAASQNDHVVPANAGIHTPSLLVSAVWRTLSFTTHARGYGPRRGGRDDVSGFFGFIKQRRASHTPSPSRDITRPSFANRFAPKKRARGRPGARCTRGLMCKDALGKNAHEHTGSAETLRPSPRSGFTAYLRALPGETRACLSPSPPRKREPPENLTPAIGASGPHDFAVRISRARQSQPSRPPLPAPTSKTMANAPLSGRDR
jgi:hypothetical protein